MEGTDDLFRELKMPLIVTCSVNICGYLIKKKNLLKNRKVDSGSHQKGIENGTHKSPRSNSNKTKYTIQESNPEALPGRAHCQRLESFEPSGWKSGKSRPSCHCKAFNLGCLFRKKVAFPTIFMNHEALCTQTVLVFEVDLSFYSPTIGNLRPREVKRLAQGHTGSYVSLG